MLIQRQAIDILHLIRLKMELDKQIHCLLFCFYPKKSAADAHRIICETYGENVIAIRTCELV